MENTPAFHPLDYVSVLRRRMWWLIVPLGIAIVVGAILLMYLPRTYQAQAMIGVSLPGVSGQLLNETQRVTSEELQQLAQEFFRPEAIAVTVLGNLNGLKISRQQLAC